MMWSEMTIAIIKVYINDKKSSEKKNLFEDQGISECWENLDQSMKHFQWQTNGK